jgi:hypothetical protein
MRNTCREGRPCSARIRDATAYAIGWLDRPPQRRYAFTARPRGPFGDDQHPRAPGHVRHTVAGAGELPESEDLHTEECEAGLDERVGPHLVP